MSAAPYRVGILDDMSETPGGLTELGRWIELSAADLREAGRLDRDIELVHAAGLGLPSGTAAAVEHAFVELVEADVLVIVGPAIGDNALVATPLAEHFEVPAINWAGTERARGKWMFHLQVGSHEDESVVLARHLSELGARRVGVVFDRSPIGRRYLEFLVDEAEVLGLTLGATAGIGPLDEVADDQLAQVLGAGCDSLVYLGLGLSVPAVARAARGQGFDGPCAMNTAGLRGHDPSFAEAIDGWHYLDMVSDDNRTFAGLKGRLDLSGPEAWAAARGYDLGRLTVEGLARAPERTREGVRLGLEQIKWLDAAEGHEGTQLGFGYYDRGALHGRYLVVRRWVGGESIESS